MKGRLLLGPQRAHLHKDLEIQLNGVITSIAGECVSDPSGAMEGIIQAYRQKGAACFAHIEGQFVLAVYDYRNGEVYLVRDKIGTVPLYYSGRSSRHGEFCWGSRIHHVVAQSGAAASVNEEAIHEYLVFRYIGGRNTLFKDVYELPPAHYLRIKPESGRVEEKRYWDIPYPGRPEMLKGDCDYFSDRLDEILTRSIKWHFAGDCRHAILLSGGVDSSLLAAIASTVTNRRIPTFFIGFNGYRGDRFADAQAVAERYHTSHSGFYLNAEQYAEGLPEAIEIHEEPLNHPGHVGRVMFTKSMQGKLDILHLGEGVDTMFCGAKVYPLMRYAYNYNPMRRLTKYLFKAVSPGMIEGRLRRYYRIVRDAFIMEPAEYVIRSLAAAGYSEADKLLVRKSDMGYLNCYRSYLLDCDRYNLQERILRLYQHPFMVEVLNSEAKFDSHFNIEHRYPFLDAELLSFANSMPFNLRSRRFTGKYIVKKLAERYLPKEIVYRRKEGFGVPLKEFFSRSRGMGRYYDLLLDRRTRERGIFNAKELRALVDRHRLNRAPAEAYEGLLWTTINLELWFRIHTENLPEKTGEMSLQLS
ncbi:MAG TPA: asparagine synthase-related protein [Dissulfurispiraceae bacterium]